MDKNNLPPITKFIGDSEGFASKPYKCTAGKVTVGYGRNLDAIGVRKEEVLHFANKYGVDIDESAVLACINNVGVTEADAAYMLNNDITAFKTEIKKTIPYFGQLPSFVQYILLDMCFNMGTKGLRGFKGMIAAIGGYHIQGKPESLDDAATELLHSQYLLDVKTRAVRNAKLLCNDFGRVKQKLASRTGTSRHLEFINKYGGK